MQPFELLQVGQPYSATRRVWDEAADFNMRSGQHELRIFLANATPRETAAAATGPIEFGLLVEPLGIFLITRFGTVMSFDCSFNWHMVDPLERTTPPPSEEVRPESRALIAIILVEATTGNVLALRAVTFSGEFTRAIHRAITDQMSAPFDRTTHQQWADSMTARYNTDQLWAKCSMRCHGGD